MALTNSSPQSGRQVVNRERGLNVVAQALELLELCDVLGPRRPRRPVLDRHVELNEAFGKVAPVAHGRLLPCSNRTSPKFTRPRDDLAPVDPAGGAK